MRRLRSSFTHELPFFLAVPAFLWQVLFFCIPLAMVVVMSVMEVAQHPGITFAHYLHFWQLPYWAVIGRSLVLALCTAIVCTLLAFPIAYHLVFNVPRWRNTLFFLLMLPFWTNLIVQVYAWFFVLEKYGLINSLLLNVGLIAEPINFLNSGLAIYLVMFYCYIPFMVMPLYTSLEKFDMRLLEASADLGARPWQTFLRITVPLVAPGIRTGFFLVFVPAFGEFIVPSLMGGGKHLYVGTLISHYFLVARNASLGSAFTCLSGVVLLITVALIYWSFRSFFSLDRGER